MASKWLKSLVVAMAALTLAGTASRADPPARIDYQVRTDAIVAAARAFPAPAARAFAAALPAAPRSPGPNLDAGYSSVPEQALFPALAALIRSSLEAGEIRQATDFLASVGSELWIRGHLTARNGGDFVTSLELSTTPDGRYLLRQVNRAIRAGEWQATTIDRPLGIAAVSRPAEAVVRDATVVFDNQNVAHVWNLPARATTFTLDEPYVITKVTTYHWNDAHGAPPGTLALGDGQGRVHGPWPARGSAGQGGVPEAYWSAIPNEWLPAGTYTVIDSDPQSWAHNAESQNRGFVRIEGVRRPR